MTSISSQQTQAAGAYVRAALEVLKTEKGVHAETVIAGVARMAGTFMFRSFNFPLENVTPGQAVLSEQANERGPGLINILAAALDSRGVHVDTSGLEQDPGTEHEPLLGFLETQATLEPIFTEINKLLGLNFEEAADAAAYATALLIEQTISVLNPDIGFNIAAYGFVEGTKTIPNPV